MAKERARKKSYQQSLEDIKEKMKERRAKRLASASAPSRGRPGGISKGNAGRNAHATLTSVQMNNASLAAALQGEKEKVRQANAVILQLKREQQALFLHLLLLKRKLREQEAQRNPPNPPSEPQHPLEAPRKRGSSCGDKAAEWNASPECAENQSNLNKLPSECKEEVTLPSTVGVRRRHAEKKGQRSSERAKKLLCQSPDSGPLVASPITSDDRTSTQPEQGAEPDYADCADAGEFQHSTPEHVAPRKPNQQRPSRRQTKQQVRSKPEPAGRKPERRRKPERAPLKKPWENPKPRARSKSRDHSASRAKGAAPSQGNKLNTSQGFNDTFDFDCEETVHITPFKAKAEDGQTATPVSEEAPRNDKAPDGMSPAPPQLAETISSSSPSSESDDSLYVPQKSRQARASPSKSGAITTRRGRISKVDRQKENAARRSKVSIFRDEPSPTAVTRKEANRPGSADASFSSSPAPGRLGRENHQAHHSEAAVDDDGLPPVSPLVEAEMMRIGGVLSNFGESAAEAPRGTHQTPQRAKARKKSVRGVRTAGRGLSLCDVTNLSPAAFRKFSSPRPADGRCSTPVPARKRRCTMVVDYKEPTLNAKLRRGDKFTDLQFLRSPIFKQKPGGRTSVRTSRNSTASQQSSNYDEAFVGCD